jgi:hypothetical protein
MLNFHLISLELFHLKHAYFYFSTLINNQFFYFLTFMHPILLDKSMNHIWLSCLLCFYETVINNYFLGVILLNLN